MKEKIMAIALSMVMLLGGTSTAFASGSNDKGVSEDLAMAIAYDFLLSREENEDIIEKLPNDYNLILSKTIYETEGVPSAYKFDIEDEKDTYHGYIVIGAQEEYAPVIEYSFSDEKGFLDSAEANEEIYYVISGSGKAIIDNEEVNLVTGDWVRISPVAERQFFANKNNAISYICIQVKENSLEGFTANDAIIK